MMDTKTASLIGNIAKFVFAIIGVILCAMILFNGVDGDNANKVDTVITLSLIGIVVAGVLAVIFGLIQFGGNIKNSLRSLGVIGGLGIITAIGYGMAKGDVSSFGEGVTTTISKWSGAGINITLILLAVAVVAALASEVLKLLK